MTTERWKAMREWYVRQPEPVPFEEVAQRFGCFHPKRVARRAKAEGWEEERQRCARVAELLPYLTRPEGEGGLGLLDVVGPDTYKLTPEWRERLGLTEDEEEVSE